MSNYRLRTIAILQLSNGAKNSHVVGYQHGKVSETYLITTDDLHVYAWRYSNTILVDTLPGRQRPQPRAS